MIDAIDEVVAMITRDFASAALLKWSYELLLGGKQGKVIIIYYYI